MAITKAGYEARQRYIHAHVSRACIKLRLEEDADIIEYIEDQKSHGYTYRQIIRELWENAR